MVRWEVGQLGKTILYPSTGRKRRWGMYVLVLIFRSFLCMYVIQGLLFMYCTLTVYIPTEQK